MRALGAAGVEILAESCPLRVGLILSRRDKVEESPDSVAGMGTADTSEIIRAKIRATRPARERIFASEYCIVICRTSRFEKNWREGEEPAD